MNHTEPPYWVVDAACAKGAESPCQKSKRGVAIYAIEECDDIIEGRARLRSDYMGRPYDEDKYKAESIYELACNAPPEGWTCTGSSACRKNCGKLCRHAEERAIHALGPHMSRVELFAMVHVKVVDGKVVAGGPPSCWQCSRLIADSGLHGIWLYETVLLDNERDDGSALSAVAIEGEPVWRFYPAAEFHRHTLAHEGMSEAGAEVSVPDHLFTIGLDRACSLCDRPRSEHHR